MGIRRGPAQVIQPDEAHNGALNRLASLIVDIAQNARRLNFVDRATSLLKAADHFASDRIPFRDSACPGSVAM